MKISEIIDKYNELGVHLWNNDDKLCFSAPVGIMTSDRKSELSENKNAILEYLKKVDNNVVITDIENKYEAFPLTDIQIAYMMGETNIYEFGETGCHIYVELEMSNLDNKKLEIAWNKVINRHEMLRTIILENGYQKLLENFVLPRVKFNNEEITSIEKFKERILETRNLLSNKKYKSNQWPLYDLWVSTYNDISILHFSLDMLIADSVSVGILLKEILYYYFNENKELKELDITYRDVVLFNKLKKSKFENVEKYKKDKRYWLDKIDDLPLAPELPMENNNGQSSNVIFENFKMIIDNDKYKNILELSRKCNITISSVILTVYTEVLALWSKNQDFCINVTTMNRDNIHEQINNIVGDFTNINILEIKSGSKKSFLEKVQAIQERLWNDMEHNSFSGIELLRELSRRKSSNVVMPFVYTSTIGIKNLFDKRVKINYRISQTPQVFIDCQVRETENGLEICWDVRKNAFKFNLEEKMFYTFKKTIETLSQNEESWKKEYIVELPEETYRVRNLINNTKKSYDKESLIDGFLKNVLERPDKKAIIYDDNQYSYRELAEYAFTFQQILIKNGFQKGQFAVVINRKGIFQIASIIGILLAGGVYVPIDNEQPVKRIEEILNDLDIKYILTSVDISKQITKRNFKIIIANDVRPIKYEYKFPKQVKVSVESPAYIIYTSGSTGKPKGVVISHLSAMNTIDDINYKFNVTFKDVVLGIANIAFDLSVYDIFGTLSAGATLVLPDSGKNMELEYLTTLLIDKKVTVWNSVPAQMQIIIPYIQSEIVNNKLKLRLAMLSGDWIPISLVKKINEIFKDIELVSLGGATEASIWSIYHKINDNDIKNSIIPYGKPLANQKFYILNSNLLECPDWVEGDIYIAGEGLALEYFNDKKLTEEKFFFHKGLQERLYKTGDIGLYREDGIIEFLGRNDTQIKIHGHRIGLSEIESTIQKYPLVETTSVVLKKEENKDYQMAAFIVPIACEKNDIKDEREEINSLLGKLSRRMTDSINGEEFKESMNNANTFILMGIIAFLQERDIFTEINREYDYDEILKRIDSDSKYFKLVKRWLNVLCSEKYIYESDINLGKYFVKQVISKIEIENTRQKIREIELKKITKNTPLKFFDLSFKNLKVLINGTKQPQEILFPKGDIENAFNVYHNNVFSNILNSLAVKGILITVDRILSENPNKTVRIMEIGAGTGGTSEDIIKKLEGKNVEYYFTDVSEFFLNKARERYKEFKWIKYNIFDINKSYFTQGIKPCFFDIIICANVIHLAVNGKQAFSMLKEISCQNGYLFIIDGIKELNSLLTSMGFLYRVDATDERKDKDLIFFQLDHWHKMLNNSKSDILFEYPPEDHFLSYSCQKLFISRFNKGKAAISENELMEYISKKVPQYMIPNTINIIEEMPLTQNTKIDRKNLESRIVNYNKIILSDGDVPKEGLEKEIASVWRKVLNSNKEIGRNDNFFELGGDSLLLAQVVGEMKKNIQSLKDIKWDTIIRIMFKFNTIASFTNAIQKKDNLEYSKADIMSIISEGSNSSEEVIALFSDGTGTLSIYNDIIKSLKNNAERNEKIVGFTYRYDNDYINYSDSELVQKIAEKCANRIIEMGYKKIRLIGHCFGGIIALETSRILKERKISNIKLILIDVKRWCEKPENELILETGFAVLTGANISELEYNMDDSIMNKILIEHKKNHEKFITENELVSEISKLIGKDNNYSRLIKLSKTERLNKIYNSIEKNGKTNYKYGLENFSHLYRVFKKSFDAFYSYKLNKYYGDIIEFYAEDMDSLFIKIPEKLEYITDIIAGGEVKKICVEGNHITCMKRPNVNKIIELI
ncbi:non-ribosomal peptide synthetase [Clostridium felsineum]|uniref:non-ribosomal peptide synthetase n=1 Tax=Clostridium felsineum TaxID=36839 RepID=UPI00098C0AB3|nr:non-ribosomal peptide synthetase [Clostridium felsineum]URZ02604.1 D-alanine--D-alanyl carrier protein ligase [Clostridium felsineum]